MVNIEVYPYCITECCYPSFKSTGYTTCYPDRDITTQKLECDHAHVCKHIEGQEPLALKTVSKYLTEPIDHPISAEEMKRTMKEIMK